MRITNNHHLTGPHQLKNITERIVLNKNNTMFIKIVDNLR